MNLEAASDRLNPIVVKEVRQGLRSRTFTVSFALLLAACVIVSLTVWDRPLGGENAGRDAFQAFFACLAVVGFLIVPIQAFRSLSGELASDAWQTMTLTTLTARQVLRGKIASQLVQGLLYVSATAPFLLFSYFLQGVALVSLLVVLVLALLWQTALVTLAAAAATFGAGKFSRGAAGAVAAGGALLAFSGGVAFAKFCVDEPEEFVRPETLAGMGAVLLFAVTLLALAFELAAGRLAPSSANVAAGPRVAVLVHLGAMGLCLPFLKAPDVDEAAYALFVWGSGLLFALGAYGLGEPDVPPRAVREKRPVFGMLVPGGLRAFRFSLFAEVVLAGALSLTVDPTNHPAGLWIYLAGPALFATYLAFGALVTRWLPQHLGTPLAARSVTFAIAGLGVALPIIVALIAGGGTDDPGLNFLNPVLAYAQGLDPGIEGVSANGALLRAGLAAVLAVLADRLLARRERAAHG